MYKFFFAFPPPLVKKMAKSSFLIEIVVVGECEQANLESLIEIGDFLAEDIFQSLDNGEDFIDVRLIGVNLRENP